MPAGGVHFRVWAPERKKVEVALAAADAPPVFVELAREGDEGYFSGVADAAHIGSLYKYRLDDGDCYPDPASRYQPEGPHEWSQVVDPTSFTWTDDAWRGVPLHGQIIYEMHIGTFTREGTWTAASRQLPALAETGVSVLELMPVAEFAGRFGWGYDGVDPFAPTRLYGTPDDMRSFVNEAHRLGLAVILDVVYNHLGPDGNYFGQFSPYYFTSDHETDWGEAINFYAAHSGPVREFFIANANYWMREYHLDGLRLDATQNIYDISPDHIVAAITREVRTAAEGRDTIVIGENEPQNTTLVRSPEEHGYGMDGLWNDDFHHTAIARLTGHNEAYYTDYLGSPQEFVSAAKYGYLYQGQWYKWQHQRRGTPTFGLPPFAFVTFIENHDQVANTARGLRVHQLTSPGLYRAMTALTILGPGTPMLFQGQEFASSVPFCYFADQGGELAHFIREGRRKFLAQFRSLASPGMWPVFPDPVDRQTFERCKLDHSERERNAAQYSFHRDLLHLKRNDPVLRVSTQVDGAVLSADAFLIRFFSIAGERLLVVNFGLDLCKDPAPEPLLAPPPGKIWGVLWSSEDARFGGEGALPLDTVENWKIPGQAAVLLSPVEPGEAEKTARLENQ